ncbi:hypothetical protein V490_05835, partial [Pseudogymnoascus sp. VKM F-3557]
MERMVGELGMREFTSSYGLTEASPTCFNARSTDSIHRKLTTVGQVLPHLSSKIVDRDGKIVPVGERGELCMAGYSLQKGYWNNPDKTAEVMIRDEAGTLWLHTGDEAVFDAEGYCTITGRFKDIIIRGGENIYPLEVESRLVSHPSGLIARAAVVGIAHPKYGEVVGAFLLPSSTTSPSSTSSTSTSSTSASAITPSPSASPTPSSTAEKVERPSDDDLRTWVRAVLGRHKAPAHIFWFGNAEVGMQEVPQTGSGKVKKHVLPKAKQRHQLPIIIPSKREESDLSRDSERAKLAPRRGAEELRHLVRGQAGGEGSIIAELLDVCGAIGAVEDNSHLDSSAGRASEVIRASTGGVGVQGRLAAVITRHQDLSDIELSASRSPARARLLAVLEGTWDLSVQHPDGGHVGVESRGGVLGHTELEEEDLVCAVEAVVGYGAGTSVAAAVASDALLVGEDGEFLVAADEGVSEDGGGGGAAGALGVEVGQGVAEDVVED